jgi:hypothetical protein
MSDFPIHQHTHFDKKHKCYVNTTEDSSGHMQRKTVQGVHRTIRAKMQLGRDRMSRADEQKALDVPTARIGSHRAMLDFFKTNKDVGNRVGKDLGQYVVLEDPALLVAFHPITRMILHKLEEVNWKIVAVEFLVSHNIINKGTGVDLIVYDKVNHVYIPIEMKVGYDKFTPEESGSTALIPETDVPMCPLNYARVQIQMTSLLLYLTYPKLPMGDPRVLHFSESSGRVRIFECPDWSLKYTQSMVADILRGQI